MTTANTDLMVAKTILEQLGGNRFRVMTGARDFVGSAKGLSFRLPGGGGHTKQGINYVQIALVGDLYTMGFYKVRGINIKEIAEVSHISDENLRETFTHHTGLDCTLGTMGR